MKYADGKNTQHLLEELWKIVEKRCEDEDVEPQSIDDMAANMIKNGDDLRKPLFYNFLTASLDIWQAITENEVDIE